MKWYSEQNLIDNVARFTPFLVLAIPATFAYQNTTNPQLLNMPNWVGWLIAISIEGLGLASVHTSLSLLEHMKTKKQKQTWEAVAVILSTLFYLAVVVLVNIVLDLHHPAEIVAAKALLSLVSIPAAVTLSIRQLHKTRLTNEAEHKVEKTAQGKLGALTKKYNELEQNNKELALTIQGLKQQIKEQNRQPKQVTAVSKTAKKSKVKTKQKAEQISCPDCGKMVNGIKGLNGHKAWCEGKQVEVYSNGHKEFS